MSAVIARLMHRGAAAALSTCVGVTLWGGLALPTRAEGTHSTPHADGDRSHPNPSHSNPSHSSTGHADAEQPMMHGHGRLEIPADAAAPQVAITLSPDALRGWNLHVQVEHFQFAPGPDAPLDAFDQGHAHLYINGEKVTRLYGPWYYLPTLPSGDVEVRVTLNTNDHRDLYVNDVAIAATTRIQVPPQTPAP
jgi:hypothetical protein